VKIYRDSRITLSSLKNTKNRKQLIEEIRKKTAALEKGKWHLQFTWIKAHVGHSRNELADKLANEAAKNREICLTKSQKVKWCA
jgi:ribonuclease HI